MNDLEEVSLTAATLIREGVEESRGFGVSAQEIIDGIRTKPVVMDGTKEALKSLSAKLEEVDELYIKVLQGVSRTYGDPTEEVVPDFGARLTIEPEVVDV